MRLLRQGALVSACSCTGESMKEVCHNDWVDTSAQDRAPTLVLVAAHGTLAGALGFGEVCLHLPCLCKDTGIPDDGCHGWL